MNCGEVTDVRQWDLLRLRDIRPTRQERARYEVGSAHRITAKLSQHLLQCPCTKDLLPHLERRRVVTNTDVISRIRALPDAEAASSLEKVLMGRSRERGEEGGKVESLYLALLDCYEQSGSEWCHKAAVGIIRPAELAVVVGRMPSVVLPPTVAERVCGRLGLGTYGPQTDLKEIVKLAMSTRVGFPDLVSALLLTPNTGRYLSLLLPYCLSNPPCVYEMLLKLGQSWRELALYLGYSNTEVEAVARAGGPGGQLPMFLRVWWVPDCGKRKTLDLLNKVHPRHLSSEQVRVKDDGGALLSACLEGNWGRAAELVKSGSYLGARCNNGRTPLMHACLKGKDRMVQLFIDHGADVQAVDQRGETCLNFTETVRNRVILEIILEEYKKQGVTVDPEPIETELSPLSTACKCGAVPSAELLLEYGADPNGCGNGRHRPLIEASAKGHLGLVRSLLKYRANVNATDKDGFTALLQACTSGHWHLAHILMDTGADVRTCAPDSTSALFLAVDANEYSVASELIQKGAFVDAVKFQSAALGEGAIEMTPLAQAAGKGLDNMVQLLLDNGADINYLCSGNFPALSFAVIGDHISTFHLLFSSENLNKTLAGLSPVISTSIRMEKRHFTELLLDPFGGPEAAMMQAQQQRLQVLVEVLLTYMDGGSLHGQTRGITRQMSRPMQLKPGEPEKINSVLTDFCRICVSAVFNNPNIQPRELMETARAMGNDAVANYFQLSNAMRDDNEMRNSFLLGEPSPLRFLIENKILTTEVFQIEVLKFYTDDVGIFYKDLVWTFQHMSGGAELPTEIAPMLTQLFTGRFIPRTLPHMETHTPGGAHYRMREPEHLPLPPISQLRISQPSLPPIPQPRTPTTPQQGVFQTPRPGALQPHVPFQHPVPQTLPQQEALTSQPPTIQAQPQDDTDTNTTTSLPSSLTRTGSTQSDVGEGTPDSAPTTAPNFSKPRQPVMEAGEGRGGNLTVPDDKSKAGCRAMENIENNTPNLSPDLARVRVMKALQFKGINSKLGGFPEYSEESCQILPNVLVHPTGVELGNGAYGDVFEVKHNGKVYAAKKYRSSTSPSNMKAFGQEIQVFHQIRHPNIVSYFGLCRIRKDSEQSSTALLMERMEKNLKEYLKEGKIILLPTKFRILRDVASGLHHLHSRHPAIIHRDLTANNILLTSDGVAKIGDFGNSRIIDLCSNSDPLTSKPGALDYMPQEALGDTYTEKLDIFSYGNLAIHIFIQDRPKLLPYNYTKKGKRIARSEVERREQHLESLKEKLGGDRHPFYILLIQCLDDEPEKRPGCEMILKCIETNRLTYQA